MNSEQNNQESRSTYFIAAFLPPLIWGFMSIPVRQIQAWPADDILNYRIITAVLLLSTYLLLFRRKAILKDKATYLALLPKERKKFTVQTFLSAILIFGNWYSYIYAINNISVQAAAFAYMICPLITAFGAFFLLKEELSKQKWIALLLASFSVYLLMTGSLLHVVVSITIAAFYAFYLIIQRTVKGFDKLNLLALQLLICSVFIIPILLLQHHPIPTSAHFWFNIVLIAVLFTIIPLFLSMYALIKISSSTTGILLYINPIIAFLLALFYFKEYVDPRRYIAYGILLLAIALFNGETITRLFIKNKK